jgi:hypothetical protein
MTRWLVLGLLLCNAIYFLWQSNAGSPSSASAQAPVAAGDGARLILLSEASKLGAPVGLASPRAEAESTAPPKPICHMIGPFKEKISAYQVRDRLKALDIDLHTYQVDIPGRPDYWVHLGPMRSRKEALDMLRELQAKKIDSFLITEGELINGISLGFYTKEELAQAVLKQRREQGYSAKIRAVPRFTQELWEVFAEGQYSKFSDDLWQKITAGTQGLELRKNSCELIASAEKLD